MPGYKTTKLMLKIITFFHNDWKDTSGSWRTPESSLNVLIISPIICNFFLIKDKWENKLVIWAFELLGIQKNENVLQIVCIVMEERAISADIRWEHCKWPLSFYFQLLGFGELRKHRWEFLTTFWWLFFHSHI